MWLYRYKYLQENKGHCSHYCSWKPWLLPAKDTIRKQNHFTPSMKMLLQASSLRSLKYTNLPLFQEIFKNGFKKASETVTKSEKCYPRMHGCFHSLQQTEDKFPADQWTSSQAYLTRAISDWQCLRRGPLAHKDKYNLVSIEHNTQEQEPSNLRVTPKG